MPKNGDIITKSQAFPWAIGVVAGPTVVGSLRLELDDVFVGTSVDSRGRKSVNDYPYILPVDLSNGRHSLEAIPYFHLNRKGIQGKGLSIDFTVR